VKRVTYASIAETDLYDIALWIAQDAGTVEPAYAFLDSIELAPRLRSWPSGPYVIFYRATAVGIEVAIPVLF
jgi:hypothetical protein